MLNSAILVNDGALLSYTDGSQPVDAWADSNDGGATQADAYIVETDANPYDTENDLAGYACAADQPCSFQVGAPLTDPRPPEYYSWSNWITPPRPPAPTLDSATIGNAGGDSLSYTAPTNPAGLTVTGYEWDSSLDGGATVYYSADADLGPSPLVVSTLGCPAGQTCSFRLLAVDGMWESPWSNWVTATPACAAAPSVTTNPSSQTVTAPAAATFTAAGSNSDPNCQTLTVQWQVSSDGGLSWSNDTTDSGSTSGTLTVSPTSASLSGNEYRAVFTNELGSTDSSAATLTVNRPACAAAPSVTTNPSSQTVTAPAAATFTAAGSNSDPNCQTLTVQWQVSSDGGLSWSNDTTDSGSTSGTLTVSPTSASLSGNEYRAVFTNELGSTDSSAATLSFSPSSECAPTTPIVPSGDYVSKVSVSFACTPAKEWTLTPVPASGAYTECAVTSTVPSGYYVSKIVGRNTTCGGTLIGGGGYQEWTLTPVPASGAYTECAVTSTVPSGYYVSKIVGRNTTCGGTLIGGGGYQEWTLTPVPASGAYTECAVTSTVPSGYYVSKIVGRNTTCGGTLIGGGGYQEWTLTPVPASGAYTECAVTSTVPSGYYVSKIVGRNTTCGGTLIGGGGYQEWTLTPVPASGAYTECAVTSTVPSGYYVSKIVGRNTTCGGTLIGGGGYQEWTLTPE